MAKLPQNYESPMPQIIHSAQSLTLISNFFWELFVFSPWAPTHDQSHVQVDVTA